MDGHSPKKGINRYWSIPISYCGGYIGYIILFHRFMDLGKLSYFTNLNCSAIKGDDSPNIHHASTEGEQWGRYNLPGWMAFQISGYLSRPVAWLLFDWNCGCSRSSRVNTSEVHSTCFLTKRMCAPNSGTNIYLVGGWALPLSKIWKSVGIIIPNLWKNKKMFQTTNQSLSD